MYWMVELLLPASRIICVEIRRLPASMKTSNSSKHRIGQLMASQRDNSRQIVEKDFSPPESDLGSFSCLDLMEKRSVSRGSAVPS